MWLTYYELRLMWARRGLIKFYLTYNKMWLTYYELRLMWARRGLIKFYLTYTKMWLTYYELRLMRMRALRAQRSFGAYLCSNAYCVIILTIMRYNNLFDLVQ